MGRTRVVRIDAQMVKLVVRRRARTRRYGHEVGAPAGARLTGSPARGMRARVQAIRAVELRKRYGDILAVDGVSIAVEAGEIFGLLGPNGAGKTTTVEMIEGLRRPDAGTVHVLGHDLAHRGGGR